MPLATRYRRRVRATGATQFTLAASMPMPVAEIAELAPDQTIKL